MRSGKPPAPWRRDRRARGPRLAVVVVLVLLFAAIGAHLLWRARPQPLPWHPVGAEKMVTPAFDIADEGARAALRHLRRAPLHEIGGEWFGDACAADAPLPTESYLLTRVQLTSHSVKTTRVLVTLSDGGEVVVERDGDGPLRRRARPLDAADIDAFRAILLDGDYSVMVPAEPEFRRDSNTVALQSCIRGRYYGVVRASPFADETSPFFAMAAAIEDLAAPGLPEVP